MNIRNLILFSMLLLPLHIMQPPGLSAAQDRDISNKNKACLGCHSKQNITILFQNSESVPGYIDESKLRASAHASFACIDCHTEFASDEHPKRNFQSHEQYKIRASLTCRRCHTDEQIRTRPVHVDILSR